MIHCKKTDSDLRLNPGCCSRKVVFLLANILLFGCMHKGADVEQSRNLAKLVVAG